MLLFNDEVGNNMAALTAQSDAIDPDRAVAANLFVVKSGLFFAILVPLLLLGAGVSEEWRQRLGAAEHDALATVAMLRGNISTALEVQEHMLSMLDRRVAGMTWDQIRASAPALSAELQAMSAGMPQVSGMNVADANGHNWAGLPPPHNIDNLPSANMASLSGLNVGDQATFNAAPLASLTAGQHSFQLGRQRTTADGTFDGTVNVAFQASYFTTLWSTVVGDRDNVAISLVRADGRVLAKYPELNSPAELGTAAESQLLRHFEDKPQGGSFISLSPTDGLNYLSAYAQVGTYPVMIAYSITVRSILASWRLHLWILGLAAVLVVAALLLAGTSAMAYMRRLAAGQARLAAIGKVAQEGQRLELLGQLAAESAHDFANILQAMRVAATLIRRAAAHPDRVRSLADRLDEDAERGASLTQRMLDLVRPNGGAVIGRTEGEGAVIDLNDVMTRVSDMLGRLLGKTYRLRCETGLAGPSPKLRGDRSELELVIMNLAVNARDAMPDGGNILIRAVAEYVSAEAGHSAPERFVAALASGTYLRLSVIDFGAGMPPDVLARAGELFFTTKPRGKGTGLGLAGARGFAERAGGRMTIQTEVGHGTNVTLWLPSIRANPFGENVAMGPELAPPAK